MPTFSKLKYAINKVKIDHSLVEELKFVRSPRDLTNFVDKVSYLFPRITGNLEKYTQIPPSLQIEPTNVCNLRCTCCSIHRSSRPRGFMDLGLFKKIVDDATDSGINRVHLYLHGEPLLHPKIIEMVTYLKAKRMAFRLVTNGSRLNTKLMGELLHSGINSADYIEFSILGFSKETHEAIMKGVNHEEVIDNILGLLEYRKNHNINGPVVKTIFFKMPENEQESKQYLEFWQGKVDHAELANRISQSFSSYKKEEKIALARTKPCSILWEKMHIFWNGDVPLCCMDIDGKYLLGNLRNQSIREIWGCEKLLSIKKIHIEKRLEDFQFCYLCDMYQ